MTPARRGATLLFVAGLAAGTLTPAPPLHEPARAGEYWLMAVDFHVHGFPGDGALPSWLLRAEAARAGLDAFALTNHNRVSTGKAARRLAAGTPGPIVIPGQEITGRGFHIAAAGLEERVDWTRGPAEAIRGVHAQGGVAIAAHPGRSFTAWNAASVALLDGHERAHPSMQRPEPGADFAAFADRAAAIKPGIAPIGSSDFHSGTEPGFCRTWVLARERTATGVLAAVRDGRTVAMDMDGRLYGEVKYLRLVQDAQVARSVVTRPTAWARASVAAAALGLLMLVLF